MKKSRTRRAPGVAGGGPGHFPRGKCGRVAGAARAAGLFLLYDRDRYEFMSARSGRTLLTWSAADHHWWAANDTRGKAGSPFEALRLAVDLERTAAGANSAPVASRVQ